MNLLAIIIILATILSILAFWKTRTTSLFNCSEAKTANMAIALAFAVGASDGEIVAQEVKEIRDWAYQNIQGAANDRKFHKGLTCTKAFFYAGHKIDSEGMCKEITKTANLAQRYDILKLCMQVTAADGIAKAKQLVFLRNIAQWLELDSVKVLMMMEAYVPVNIHEVKDVEFILGINTNMPLQEAQSKLSREYRKWNGRVTNPDKNIREQARIMTELIASLRNKYLGRQVLQNS